MFQRILIAAVLAAAGTAATSASAQTFSRQQLLQQWQVTCSPQSLRLVPALAFQCQQWRQTIDSLPQGEASGDEREDTDILAPHGRTVLGQPGSPTSAAPTAQSLNHCVHTRAQRDSDGFLLWEFRNNCPVPVSLAWCNDGDRCTKPGSSRELRAGEVYTTHALVRDSRGPRTLACPTDSFNAIGRGDVWACWARR